MTTINCLVIIIILATIIPGETNISTDAQYSTILSYNQTTGVTIIIRSSKLRMCKVVVLLFPTCYEYIHKAIRNQGT